MKKILQGVIVYVVILSSLAYSLDVLEKYPSYRYVFNAFDVDYQYIYNQQFQDFIKNNEKKLKTFYENSLKKGKEILPTMQGLLLDEDVNDLFIYLSMAESGFSSLAISPKKAAGLWQFMPQTARAYHLSVNSEIDERYDVLAATVAAIHYLHTLHDTFGKWYLAAMAYNCGEGCVHSAIEHAHSRELGILLSKEKDYLPAETQRYIQKILLLAMIGEKSTIDFGLEHETTTSHKLIQVEISIQTDLKEIARLINMDSKRLKQMNKKVIKKENTKDKYTINIPLNKVYAFYFKYQLPTPRKITKSHLISYVVKLGDTLEKISAQFKTKKHDIMIANHLESENLVMDMLLLIPVSKNVFKKVENTMK